jgi:hypothetical protein
MLLRLTNLFSQRLCFDLTEPVLFHDDNTVVAAIAPSYCDP